MNTLRSLLVEQYDSDWLGAYPNLVSYPGKHQALPTKSQIYTVEADHAELRHSLATWPAGLRRSRGFTRSLAALRAAVKLFVFAWNRRQLFRRAHPTNPAHISNLVYP